MVQYLLSPAFAKAQRSQEIAKAVSTLLSLKSTEVSCLNKPQEISSANKGCILTRHTQKCAFCINYKSTTLVSYGIQVSNIKWSKENFAFQTIVFWPLISKSNNFGLKLRFQSLFIEINF